MKHKKPIYRFFIFDKAKKKPVINPDTKKPYCFEYAEQGEMFIQRRLQGSYNFEVVRLK